MKRFGVSVVIANFGKNLILNSVFGSSSSLKGKLFAAAAKN